MNFITASTEDWIFYLVFILLAGLSSLFQKRRRTGKKEGKEASWEEELRKLLEKEIGGPAVPPASKREPTPPTPRVEPSPSPIFQSSGPPQVPRTVEVPPPPSVSKPTPTAESSEVSLEESEISPPPPSKPLEARPTALVLAQQAIAKRDESYQRVAHLQREVQRRLEGILPTQKYGTPESLLHLRSESPFVKRRVNPALVKLIQMMRDPKTAWEAIVMTEVLGPPRAFRDLESLWW